MTWLVLALTTFLVVATVLPFWRNPHWMVRGWDFPRVQLSVLAAVLFLCQLMLLNLAQVWSWFVITVTLGCLLWQLGWILPYTRIWRPESKASQQDSVEYRLSILTANVLTPNRQAETLMQLVMRYSPDILVTLESDQWWQDQLDVLESDMPYTIKCPLDNLYGMHVYSRLPLEDEEISFLVEDEVPSMHARVRLRSGDRVRVHFLHPAPPSPTENPESAERDAELVVVARSVSESDQPVVVTGDLNDVAWSKSTRTFRKISGLLDPRVGRGMFNTFHARYPFLRWPLDHLFHSHHFAIKDIERTPSFGSDHFALFSVLSFEPENPTEGNDLSVAAEDQQWAEATVKEQDVTKNEVPRPGK